MIVSKVFISRDSAYFHRGARFSPGFPFLFPKCRQRSYPFPMKTICSGCCALPGKAAPQDLAGLYRNREKHIRRRQKQTEKTPPFGSRFRNSDNVQNFLHIFLGLARSSSPLPEIRPSWETFAHPRSGCLFLFLVTKNSLRS